MRLGLDRCECNNPCALKHPIESALQDLMDRKWVQETDLDEPQRIQEPRIKSSCEPCFKSKGAGRWAAGAGSKSLSQDREMKKKDQSTAV